MQKTYFKVFRSITYSMVALLLLAAVLLGSARLLSPFLDNYQEQFEAYASERLDAPVTIDHIEVTWHFLKPMVIFQNVQILEPSKRYPLIKVKEISVGINVLESLWQRTFEPGILIASGAHFVTKVQPEGGVKILGIPQALGSAETTQHSLNAKALRKWLFGQKKLALRNIEVDIYSPHHKPVKVSNFSVELNNVLDNHSLHGIAIVNNHAHTQVQFNGHMTGKMSNIKHIHGKFRIYGQHLNFTSLAKFFPALPIKPQSGFGELVLSGRVKQGRLSKLQADMNLQDVTLKSAQVTLPMRINQAAGSVQWQRQKNHGWDITAEQLQLVINGVNWPDEDISIQYADKSGQHEYAVSLTYLPMNQTLQVAHSLALNKQLQPLINDLQPRGEVRDLSADLIFKDKQLKDYHIATSLKHFSAKAWHKFPGIKNFSAALDLTPQQGKLHIDSLNTVLYMPTMFRQSLPLQQLQGDVLWQQQADGVIVTAPSMAVTTDKANASTHFRLFLPKDKQRSPTIEMLAGMKVQNATQKDAYRYMPVGVLPTPVVKYLDASVKGAEELKASLVLRGPLRDFPFEDGQGTFLIEAQVTNGRLKYYSEWPTATQLSGFLRFNSRSMFIDMDHGVMAGLPIEKITAAIPYMGEKHPVTLHVTAKVKSELDKGMSFLRASPLHAMLGKEIDYIQMQGPMGVNLDLTVPLVDDNPKHTLKLKSLIAMHDGELVLPSWDLHVTNLQGRLHITEQSIRANKLKARIFDKPASIHISSALNPQGKMIAQLDIAGELSTDALAKQFNPVLSDYLQGKSPYQAKLRLSNGADNQLLIYSDLKGINSNLPAPLHKSVNTSTPTELTLDFAQQDQVQLMLRYGEKINMNVNLRDHGKGLGFDRGSVHLGGESTVLPKHKGLVVDGHIAKLSVDAWQQVFKALMPSSQPRARLTLPWLQAVKIDIGALTMLGHNFPLMNIDAQHRLHDWLVKLSSPMISGAVTLPNAKQKPIVMNFSKIQWPKSKKTASTSVTTLSPLDIPTVNFSCKRLVYGKLPLGQVTINLVHKPNGISITQFSTRTTDLDIVARGDWLRTATGDHTHVYGQFISRDVAKTLADFQVKNSLHSRSGKLIFSLDWPSALLDPHLASVVGDVSVELKQGHIVGLSQDADEKVGLGRLVTLLSLQSLPRRIRLDFSDLTHKGFYFDKLQGDFHLTQGNAKTKNTYLKSTVAFVGITGTIGLVSHQYDLKMSVVPHLTSSLPVVATIAGGPVAGVITWVVDKALSPELDKMASNIYSIKGPWETPKITELKKS